MIGTIAVWAIVVSAVIAVVGAMRGTGIFSDEFMDRRAACPESRGGTGEPGQPAPSSAP